MKTEGPPSGRVTEVQETEKKGKKREKIEAKRHEANRGKKDMEAGLETVKEQADTGLGDRRERQEIKQVPAEGDERASRHGTPHPHPHPRLQESRRRSSMVE